MQPFANCFKNNFRYIKMFILSVFFINQSTYFFKLYSMTQSTIGEVSLQILLIVLLKQQYISYGTVTVKLHLHYHKFLSMFKSCCLSSICRMILLSLLFTHQKSSSYFKYQHPTHCHPNISLNTIVRMLRKISGTETKQHIRYYFVRPRSEKDTVNFMGQ